MSNSDLLQRSLAAVWHPCTQMKQHADVVAALRAVGAQVQSLAMVGAGCPDLLVAFRGLWYVLEVKDGTKPLSHRKLTPAEAEWVQSFGDVAPVFVVNSVDDALRAIEAI